MLNLVQLLADELSLKTSQIQAALDLFAEGATVPFIARYRKERTDSMDEIQLRSLDERFAYLTELQDRKKTILESIESQGKLTDDLRRKITTTLVKTELEDLYLPYRQKRRTRATIAKEKGLEPLADWIKNLNQLNAPIAELNQEAANYIDLEKGVKSPEEALAGVSDILAEEIADRADLRSHLREFFLKTGLFISHLKDGHPEGTTKFEMYRKYNAKVNTYFYLETGLLQGTRDGHTHYQMIPIQLQPYFLSRYKTDLEIGRAHV